MSLAVSRWPQFVLIVCTLACCWLAMQIVHELGHVLGAWWTGGTVSKVVLRPWTLSRTVLAANPDPRLVAWAGPVFGALAPLGLWSAAKIARFPSAYLLRFFAGFCLVANGAYLAGGALDAQGDAGDLQRHGVSIFPLLLFALVTVPAGLWLWHGQGRYFGFAGAGGRVNSQAVWATAISLPFLVGLEFLLGSDG